MRSLEIKGQKAVCKRDGKCLVELCVVNSLLSLALCGCLMGQSSLCCVGTGNTVTDTGKLCSREQSITHW